MLPLAMFMASGWCLIFKVAWLFVKFTRVGRLCFKLVYALIYFWVWNRERKKEETLLP